MHLWEHSIKQGIFDCRVKCDKQEDINTKLKQISLEKCKLKLLDPAALMTISKRIGLLKANAQKATPKVVINNNNEETAAIAKDIVGKSAKDTEQPFVVIPKATVANHEESNPVTNTVSPPEVPITVENSTNGPETPNEAIEINIVDIVSIFGSRIVDLFRLRLTSFRPVYSPTTKHHQ